MPRSKRASSQVAWALLAEGVEQARLEVHRIRLMSDRIMRMVDSSEARDHLHQVAGDMIQGFPERLSSAERALDRTSYALSVMGEDFLRGRISIDDREQVDEALKTSPFASLRDKESRAAGRVALRFLEQSAAERVAERFLEAGFPRDSVSELTNDLRNLVTILPYGKERFSDDGPLSGSMTFQSAYGTFRVTYMKTRNGWVGTVAKVESIHPGSPALSEKKVAADKALVFVLKVRSFVEGFPKEAAKKPKAVAPSAEGFFFHNPEMREVRQFSNSEAISNKPAVAVEAVKESDSPDRTVSKARSQAKKAPPDPTKIEKMPGGKAFSTLNRYLVETEQPGVKGVPESHEEVPKHPKIVASQDPIYVFADEENGTESRIFDNRRGYTVALFDLESGNTLPAMKIFADLEKAVRYAKKIANVR